MKFDRQKFVNWLRNQATGLEKLGCFGNECMPCLQRRLSNGYSLNIDFTLVELGIPQDRVNTLLVRMPFFSTINDFVDAVEREYMQAARDSCCL